MTTGDQVFGKLRAAAQSARDKTGKPAPTQEFLTRHVLESFLDRLSRTEHAQDFILKGGILLAAYGARRPTKDVDANAVSADVTSQHLSMVVQDVAAVEIADGVHFRPETITVQDIREHAEYPGFRIRVTANVANWAGTVAWDVSTGDPIVPAPRVVKVPRILGESFELCRGRCPAPQGHSGTRQPASRGLRRHRSGQVGRVETQAGVGVRV